MSNISTKIGFYSVNQLEIYIRKNFGDKVSWDGKSENRTEFGRNISLGTAIETVQGKGGNDTYLTSNGITHFASSDAGDTQDIIIEGSTIDGNGDFTHVIQTVTLAGQTKTAITTPLARIDRMYNDNGADFLGDVYFSTDVVYTAGVPASGIYMKVLVDFNQSEKCATTIDKNTYWAITQCSFSMRRDGGAAAAVDFSLEVRHKGKVFRVVRAPITVSKESSTIIVPYNYPIIVPPNSDVRIRARSSAAGTPVGASIHGTLLTKYSIL